MDRKSAGTTDTSIERHYRYDMKFHLFTFLYGPFSVLVFVGLGVAVEIFGIGAGRLYAALFCISWGTFMLALLVAGFLIHRPISVDDAGIWDNLLGQKRQYIPWDKMTEIVRRRYRNSLSNRDRDRYLCSGQGKTIQFDDNLQNLRGLLDDINIHAARYNIKIFLSDAGLELQKRILSEQIGPSKMRKQLREGIKTQLPSL